MTGVHLDREAMAERLGISVRQLFAETKAGRVPHLRLGRRVLYPLAAVEEWERTTALAALDASPAPLEVVDRPRRRPRRRTA